MEGFFYMTNSGIYAGDGTCYNNSDFSPTFLYLGLKPISNLTLSPGINAGVSQNLTTSLAWVSDILVNGH